MDHSANFTLAGIWASTGLFARCIIFALAIMSVASLVVMAERIIVFRKTRKDSRNFAAKMGAIGRRSYKSDRTATCAYFIKRCFIYLA